MYDFEWHDRELQKLSRDLDEKRVSKSEFDQRMSELQKRKAKEADFFKRHPPETYGDDGILWA